MLSPNAWGSVRERGGDGHLFWIMLLVGVGLNSSGDPDKLTIFSGFSVGFCINEEVICYQFELGK